MKANFRCGADPEVFLLNASKQLVSCVGLVQGTKEHPMQIEGLPKGFTLQQDNVALEFGIPPASSKEEFVQYINIVKRAGQEFLKGLSYSDSSCEVFPEDQMQTAEAHVFGCEPDFNAWTGEVNPSPQPPHPYMRSAGGHVHVETKLPPNAVGQAMDLFLGLPSMFKDVNGAPRRALYGKPGAIRYKPYGLEYRTLSNFWIKRRSLMAWVWDATEQAVKFTANGGVVSREVEDVINTNNLVRAKELMQHYGVAK
jgi:hypothetical protein